jgi:hypothetical protein
MDMAGAVRQAVASGSMPPWSLDGDCNEYRDDLSMSDAERATLIEWLDAGLPEGDPATSVAGSPPEMAGLSRVDHELAMPEPYVPTVSPDDYRCFLIDWPVETYTHLTGFDVIPGDLDIVHHVIAFILPPESRPELEALDEADAGQGYTCFGGPGVESLESAIWLGSWAPGSRLGDLPDGVGIPVQPDSTVVLQVHHNTEVAPPAPSLTTLRIQVEDEVDEPVEVQPWANPLWLYTDAMELPPGEVTTHGFGYTMTRDTQLYTASFHMHKLGLEAKLWVEHPDGSETCVLHDTDWDFDWQRGYRLKEPVQVQEGDTVHIECTWDNNTDQPVGWGDSTEDEMCLGVMLWTDKTE